MNDKKAIVNFFFEVGMLSKTPRSFHPFLGYGKQSVAEHINRVVYIGYVLAMLEGDVDMGKVLKICLLHDLAEARTGDLNYVHQKYVASDELKVIKELTKPLTFGNDIRNILNELKEKITREVLLARDADQLEFILSVKEQGDIGNTKASSWLPSALKRLQTSIAQELAEEILKTDADEWWFVNKEDDWWVNRNKKVMKKRF